MSNEIKTGQILQNSDNSGEIVVPSLLSIKASLECANSILDDLDEEDPEDAEEIILKNLEPNRGTKPTTKTTS